MVPVLGLPDVRPGDDLAALLKGADLRPGDIVVITSKIVSKAENRLRDAPDRTAAIEEETERVVARRGDMVIAQTRHGFVMAAAGVDNSNVAPGTVLLLPEDSDASARRIRAGLPRGVGVIISDTFGRPWRNGLTDVAIGAAGVLPLEDFRGGEDSYGNPLNATVTALADEIAAAAELVKGKLAGVPVAVVRGLAHLLTREDGPGVRPLIRPADEDLFRYGSRDVVPARRTIRDFTDDPVDPWLVRQAVEAAFTAPGAGHTRFALVESPAVREKLVKAPYLVVACVTEPGEQAAARAGAAVQSLLIQLAMEGLGSAWLPPGGGEEILDLPEGWRPIALVAVGHPAETPADREPQDFAARIVLR
ncbi:coenzyme F420-0:L-glutamate ligase [Nonomuraea endophytica]|uniref:Coenzyme F420-0:L-glutamate ligase/coenzyme F420-1:gamma-L-glutamate ligase n=1 Tax=Nonomuraea endophytica TaxID=714136 RepID=A0A7W7ZWG7_9ACTN|nr:coenzyme F420-0:L-glutamate ligase [Nonomuraea endophytica]MBB5074764.1 coenzyme F420-0:L-glutamate ligase/coenzyme F420-1:gamma-L-glutamate ligase [Nonomuraea endophytica]